MSFLRGFLGGMANQYNANVAAQKKEEAEAALVDREYGYRQRIENQKSAAEALLQEEAFSNDMFLEAIRAENEERLVGLRGAEDRATESLKAKLDGTAPVASYNIGVGAGGKPISLSIPKPAGSTEREKVTNNMLWFENNGLETYRKLKEAGDPAALSDFVSRAASALDSRFSQPDIMLQDKDKNRVIYVDKLGQYQNYSQLLRESPELLEIVKGSLIPDIASRLRKQAGFDDTFKDLEVTTDSNGQKVISVQSAPDWMKNSEGMVDMESYRQVRGIQYESGIPLESFYKFIENTSSGTPESIRNKFAVWKEIDNLYQPDPNASQLTPYLSPLAKNKVAVKMSDIRHKNPELAFEYFRYVAGNDNFEISRTIDPLRVGNFMSATEMKDMYKVDPSAQGNLAVSARRVVRMADGILQSQQRGGKIGLAASLQLTVAGGQQAFRDLLEVGNDIIGLFDGVAATTDADSRIRKENMEFIKGVHSSLSSGGSVSDTALIRYYSTLLAYSMAVAVQGGDAAARTVSDQDVQRVAQGVAPAAPGGRAIISEEELYTITLSARHEMLERAVIAEGYASQDSVQARASYYYTQTYGSRATDFRSLMKYAMSDAAIYDNVFGSSEFSQPQGAFSLSGPTGGDVLSSFEKAQQARSPQVVPGPLPSTITPR